MRPKPHELKVEKYGEEIKEYERERAEYYREQLRKDIREFLEAKDREASKEVLRQGGYESKGVVERRIMTSVGEVRVGCRCYRRKNGQTVYPLRDVCGLGGMTEAARELCVRFAVERSYGWSAQTLREVQGMDVSAMRVWTVVQEEGRKRKVKLDEERKKIFQEARGAVEGVKKPVIVEMDGTMLSSREAGQRDEFGRRRMEVKLGVMFRGVVGKKRRRTVDRWVYAEVAGQDAFGEGLYTECYRQGLRTTEGVEVIGDGASWVRNIQQAVFPRSRYRLDLYHLMENARHVLLDYQHQKFFTFIKANLPRTALAYLKGLHPSDERHQEKLQAFVQYVEENLDGMNYFPGEVHGSGVIEKMADLVVKKRMKRQGMRWSTRGANNLLALRSWTINENYRKMSLAASS